MKQIVMYGNSYTCSNCIVAKNYFDKLGEQITYFDLGTEDKLARIQYKKELFSLGINLIPAIFIDDNPVVIGFDEDKINEYLAKR